MEKSDDVTRAVQKIMEQAGKEASYLAGNTTANSLATAQQVEDVVQGVMTGNRWAFGAECCRAVGGTLYKATEDYSEGDPVCTGLCLVATACEFVAGGSAIIKYKGVVKVYAAAKGISMGCIRYRDMCRTAQGKNFLCT